VSGGRVMRSVVGDELIELYPEAVAAAMPDNDTSFVALGSIGDPANERDAYRFTSAAAQFVTVVLVPENALSDFDLELTDAAGATIAVSDSGRMIDFVQLRVDAGTTLGARVSA